jgi:hypothetical protein
MLSQFVFSLSHSPGVLNLFLGQKRTMRALVVLLFLLAFVFGSSLGIETDPLSRREKKWKQKQKKGRWAPKMSHKKRPQQVTDLGQIEPGTTFTCSPNSLFTGECGSCPAPQQPSKNPTDQPTSSPSSPEATVAPTNQPSGSPIRNPEATDVVEYQITAVDRPFDDPLQLAVPTQVSFRCSTSVSEVISTASCELESNSESSWVCTALPNVIPNAVFAQVRCESAGALRMSNAAKSVLSVIIEKSGEPVICDNFERDQCITGVNAVVCTSNTEFHASSEWGCE